MTSNPPHPDGGVALAVDAWYAEALAAAGAAAHSFDTLAQRQVWRGVWRGAQKVAPLRGLLCWWLARGAGQVVFSFASPGLPAFLLLEALSRPRSRRVTLVEFLRGPSRGRLGPLKEAVHEALYRWLLPRTVASAQVMTQWERQHYAAKYRTGEHLFRFVAFPMMIGAAPLGPSTARPPAYVLASGRAACDWATLFAAAAQARWPLVVVCSRQDLPLVNALNRDGRAVVHSEIDAQHHAQLLRECTVYALVLREQQASSGQVRLARAIEAGVPVVATAVLGLEGYLVDGVTGVSVGPGGAAALRAAVDRLIEDEALRRALRQRAHDAMAARSLPSYVADIKALIQASR